MVSALWGAAGFQNPCAPQQAHQLFVQKFQHLGGMRPRVGYWYPVLLDCTVRSNQRRRANGSFDGFTLGIFARSPSAVGSHHLHLAILQKHEREIKLVNELIVVINTIFTDDYYDSI